MSGQALDSRLLMLSSMDASGNLLVLKRRVPGPIRTAYVLVTKIAHKIARMVSSARTPAGKSSLIAVAVAFAVAVANGLPKGTGPVAVPGVFPSGPPVATPIP